MPSALLRSQVGREASPRVGFATLTSNDVARRMIGSVSRLNGATPLPPSLSIILLDVTSFLLHSCRVFTPVSSFFGACGEATPLVPKERRHAFGLIYRDLHVIGGEFENKSI